MSTVRRLVRRQPLGVAGAEVALALVVTAVLAPVLAPHGQKDAAFAQYVAPGREFYKNSPSAYDNITFMKVWLTN